MTIRAVSAVLALALVASFTLSCSRGDGGGSSHTGATAAPALQPPTAPNYYAGPPDYSQSVVQRTAQVQIAYPTVSAPLRDIPNALPPVEKFERAPRRSPFPFADSTRPDPVVQSFVPSVTPL